jgi:aminoglycoside phosphotransferase family enzyme
MGNVAPSQSYPETVVSLADKLRFLGGRQAHGGQVDQVTVRETHMSWIFLAGDHAYKLKKPVRLPYLDFTTLQRRQAACRAELRLNRRLAPSVYRDVVPLVQGAAGLSIGGPGHVVDWLVHMRRLDEADVLETRLRNHVQNEELDRLAATLARFYRHAEPAHISRVAYQAAWSKALTCNRRMLLDARWGLPSGSVRRIDQVMRTFLARRGRQLGDRVKRRRILNAHGDLRPEHIWMEKPIQIIDSLEFSAALRANDPMDEIAFLDMECERLGAPAAGRRIRTRVLGALNERRPEPLYSFYRCYRATLRARLAIAHLLEPNPRTPEKWPGLARTYLALALQDAVRIEQSLRRPSGLSAPGGGAGGRSQPPAAAPRTGCRSWRGPGDRPV